MGYWITWHCDTFISAYFGSPCQYRFTNASCSYLIYVQPTLSDLSGWWYSLIENEHKHTHTHTQKQDKENLALDLCASLSKLVEGVEAQLLELKPWHYKKASRQLQSWMFLYWYNAPDKIVWGPWHGTAVSGRPTIAEVRGRSKSNICGVCNGQSGTEVGCCPNN